MEITLKNQFITLWNTYFPQAGLPITFQYSADTQNLPIVEAPKGHRCIIAQLTQVQRGKTLCIQADSVGCRGGKRYTNFTDKMFPGFECFLSHNEQGEGERYKQTPELAAAALAQLPALPVKGENLIFKRCAMLATTARHGNRSKHEKSAVRAKQTAHSAKNQYRGGLCFCQEERHIHFSLHKVPILLFFSKSNIKSAQN